MILCIWDFQVIRQTDCLTVSKHSIGPRVTLKVQPFYGSRVGNKPIGLLPCASILASRHAMVMLCRLLMTLHKVLDLYFFETTVAAYFSS